MSAHISDDLPRLLTGDANRDIVLAAADHLRVCPDCQQELVSAVVAHASLTSAHRFAPEVVNPAADADPIVSTETPPAALPDLSGMFAQVREEAVVAAARPTRHRRLALIAVAAAVVVGAGAVTIAETTGSSPSDTQSVALGSLSGSRSGATATLVSDTHLKINATSLPKLDAGRVYEVWLTSEKDQAADDPQSIGFIDSDRKADITLPARVMSRYDTIAVSVQKPHQTEYSGVTVLIGTYHA